jgi:aminoglycoside/choline kinase family phosphotransferase
MELDTRIGVLDFQDGGIGPVPYDLASLCESVRRDCSLAALDEMIGHYMDHVKNP